MQDMAADRIPPMLQPSVHSIIDGYVDKFRDNTLQQVRGVLARSACRPLLAECPTHVPFVHALHPSLGARTGWSPKVKCFASPKCAVRTDTRKTQPEFNSVPGNPLTFTRHPPALGFLCACAQVPQSCEDSLRSKADNSNMAWLLHKVGAGGGGGGWRQHPGQGTRQHTPHTTMC